MSDNRPKIGVALSGASGRAIAHIGVLEVFKENNIPIDYLVGCSSGALIAASYVSDTTEELKDTLHSLTISEMLKVWTTKDATGGLFHMHNADPLFNKFIKGMTFEQVKSPKLGFVTTDINTGKLVNLMKGDMLKAFKAAVAVPGLFEPIVIDNKVLVDGGLVNIVPTKAVKDMGSDIVIGVNIAATQFILRRLLPTWRGYRFMTRLLGLQFLREKVWPKLSSRIMFKFDTQSDALEEENIKIPGVFALLAKALDHTVTIYDQWTDSEMACDVMLEPRVKHFGSADFSNLDPIYKEGRRAAQNALPQIRKLIEEKSKLSPN